MAEYLFPYRWHLADGYPAKGIKPNGCKVFGTFICGGGSTMGYKLAGYEHLGGVEIDPKIADVYRENHHLKYLFIEDIRLFNQRTDLPAEFFDLDLLDGSPPCSTFSTSGSREKAWGKKKQFREGQVVQILDDLVFEYVKTIDKLQPKVCLLENVSGIIKGNAKAYSKEIIHRMTAAGYRVQIFLLNAASMGVPQKRERVFFIGLRKDFVLPKLDLKFNESPVFYGKIRINGFSDNPLTEYDLKIWNNKRKGDRDYADILIRTENRNSNWNSKWIYDEEVCQTVTSTYGSKLISFSEPKMLSNDELKLIGSYPLDYNFKSIEPKYLIGMSVPPVMAAQIAHQIWLKWLSKIKK